MCVSCRENPEPPVRRVLLEFKPLHLAQVSIHPQPTDAMLLRDELSTWRCKTCEKRVLLTSAVRSQLTASWLLLSSSCEALALFVDMSLTSLLTLEPVAIVWPFRP